MPSSTLNLSELDGSNGFGINSPDRFGYNYSNARLSISNAGDINGDGFTDLFVQFADDNYGEYASGSRRGYVVFGSPNLGASGSIDLSTLDGSNGFRLSGFDGGYFSLGFGGTSTSADLSFSRAGDINGDGIDDLIIGVPSFLDPVHSSAYVVFGSADVGAGGILYLPTLDGSNGFNLGGLFSNNTIVSTIGDINGDGIADLISVPDANYLDHATTPIYVVFGGTNIGAGGNIDPSTLDGSNGFVINGIRTNGDPLFRSVTITSISDINNDGIADLIADPNDIGNAGSTYVLFGGTNIGAGGSIDTSTLDGSNGFVINGTTQNDYLGRSFTTASDINNDGIADLIIGAPGADPNGRNAGSTYVLFGGTNIGTGGSIDLSTLDGSNGFAINGTTQNDRLGNSFTTASDINNDGIADLIIGAPGANPNGILDAGSTYVLFGGTDIGAGGSIDPSTLNGSNGFVINGTNQYDSLGSSVISNSDINNDGIADLILGVPYADPNGIRDAGSTYVVFGGTNIGAGGTLDLSALNGSNGFVINGFVEGGASGASIQGLGDINSDGIDDVIISNFSSYGGDPNGSISSYVVFGSPASVASSTADNDTLIGTDAGEFIRGNAGDDLINGRGGDDILLGDFGDDTLIGGSGDDLLMGSFGNDSLVGGAGSDRFSLVSNLGTDTIADFESGVDALALFGGLTFGQLDITQSDNDTLISVAGTGEVLATLTGVQANVLTAADFTTL